MEYYERYSGSFVSQKGITWRVEIWQERSAPYASVGELTFDAEDPLVITWERKGKEEVMLGSTCTLRVVSPGDRTYIDLYTVDVCAVQARVYRDDKLWWVGALDPEFYEEPYERLNGYTVELTFSDLGVLERLKHETTSGYESVLDCLYTALGRAGLGDLPVENAALVSTTRNGATLDLAKVVVDAANWVDEDGEVSSEKDVLEGMLQPLGLRVMQRGGEIWLHDINALATMNKTAEVEWDGDSQTLGVDKVGNEVVITFSPYADAEVLNGSMEYSDLGTLSNGAESLIWTDYGGYQEMGFAVQVVSDASSISGINTINPVPSWPLPLTVHAPAVLAGLKSYYSGEDTACVLWAFKGGKKQTDIVYNTWKVNDGVPLLTHPGSTGRGKGTIGGGTSAKIITVDGGHVTVDGAKDTLLKVTLSMCCDVRYNPYESVSYNNEEGNSDSLKNWANFAYIPVKLLLVDESGTVLYHYTNAGVCDSDSYAHTTQNCKWVAGAGTSRDMWLCWYDLKDRKSASGLGGWSENRPIIGYFRGEMPTLFEKRGTGEYIDLPPVSGWLRLEVYSGIYHMDYGEECKGKLQPLLRWMMYKDPKIEVVDTWGNAVKGDDIEYRGTLHTGAKEAIEIDTVCGSSENPLPGARGLLMWSESGNVVPLGKLTRGGETDLPERLLMNTLHSQYATRHTTLQGEAVTGDGWPRTMTERNQPSGRLFMVSGETMHAIEGTSELELTEVSADDYCPFSNA